MGDQDVEGTAVDTAFDSAIAVGEKAVDAVVGAGEAVGQAITESIPAQIVKAIDRIVATQAQQTQILEAMRNDFIENINALSRAQANTDVSAQRAAESAGEIAEALTPEGDNSPDQSQRPENVRQLPQADADTQKKRGVTGFGKAAARHGRSAAR